MRGAEVLILHGSPGAGKSTLARVLSELLRERDVTHAVIDVDDLNLVHPQQEPGFALNNLRTIWPHYAAVAGMKLMVPTVIRDEQELVALRTALPADPFRVCELTAARSVLEERVALREPNEYWRRRLLAFVDLYDRRTDLQNIRDFEVATDGRSPAGVAEEVIARAGWFERTR